ncbi:ACR, YagE family COG1723 domain-containing protein [Toxoplasma gondii VAND]|uniref:ACR, YagE family COG1723 domain-containing protein n=1 Tax=Toxoplasma gondii VAND TaxID=933077 RepID=A0A086PJC0_TOXGO|nr:ACR, YagE family COG1723 domain-containing protein [Toxoplasma gondii VAND]
MAGLSRLSARERPALASSSSALRPREDSAHEEDSTLRRRGCSSQSPNLETCGGSFCDEGKSLSPAPSRRRAPPTLSSQQVPAAVLGAPNTPQSLRRSAAKRRQRRAPAGKNAWNTTKFLRQFEDEQHETQEERLWFPVHSMCQAEGYNLRTLYEALIARHCYARFLDDRGTVLYLELPDSDLPVVEVKACSQDRYETFLRVLAPGARRSSRSPSAFPRAGGASPADRRWAAQADAAPGRVDARPLLSASVQSEEEGPGEDSVDSFLKRHGSLHRDFSAPPRGHFSRGREPEEAEEEAEAKEAANRRRERWEASGRRLRAREAHTFDFFHEEARSRSQSSVSSTSSTGRSACAGRCEGREEGDGDSEQLLGAPGRGASRSPDHRGARCERDLGPDDLSDDETAGPSRKHASSRRRREKKTGAVSAALSPTFSLSPAECFGSLESSPNKRGFFGHLLGSQTCFAETRPSTFSSFSPFAWAGAARKTSPFSSEAKRACRGRQDEGVQDAYFSLAEDAARGGDASRVLFWQPRRDMEDREEGVEHEKDREPQADRTGSCFVFSNGAVVVWGGGDVGGAEIRRDMLSTLVWFLGRFATGFLRVDMTQEDVMFYSYIDDLRKWSSASAIPRRRIKQNRLYLKTRDVSEKLAASFAIAQSVRLDVYEALVNDTIARVQEVPERMSRLGCDFSAGEGHPSGWRSLLHFPSFLKERDEEHSDAYNKQFADLSVRIITVNIVENFLDVPDFFWEDDKWQAFWHRVHHHLQLQERIDILNTRYSCILELLNVVRREQCQDHEFRMTWIIVLLLVAQVVAAAVKYVVLDEP